MQDLQLNNIYLFGIPTQLPSVHCSPLGLPPYPACGTRLGCAEGAAEGATVTVVVTVEWCLHLRWFLCLVTVSVTVWVSHASARSRIFAIAPAVAVADVVGSRLFDLGFPVVTVVTLVATLVATAMDDTLAVAVSVLSVKSGAAVDKQKSQSGPEQLEELAYGNAERLGFRGQAHVLAYVAVGIGCVAVFQLIEKSNPTGAGFGIGVQVI